MSRNAHSTCGKLATLLAFLLVSWSSTRGVAELHAPPLPVTWLDDAELADVFFVDPDRGWAVGDRGAIWASSDGGRNWQLQTSGVTCRLDSVFFVDQQNGWIVGGQNRPYSPHTTGVVLRTIDGGRHWSPIPRLQVPWLRKVCFFDQRHGIAYGVASSMYPTGLVRTADGGRTWVSVPGDTAGPWFAGDFAFDGSGVLLGPDRTAVIDGSRRPLETFTRANLGMAHVHDVRLTLSGVSWAVGDGGAVLISRDGGVNWKALHGNWPAVSRTDVDFRTVATAGRRCWIAGAPGTVVHQSDDEGRTWTTNWTGQSVPIHSLFFLDEDRGWAVGAMGTILATRDGGQTWRNQRPTRRAAMMAVYARSEDIPFELLAQLSGNEGYRSIVEIVTRQDREAAADNRNARQLQQAVVLAGGSGASLAWEFPTRQPGLNMSAAATLGIWNQIYRGQAENHLEEYLVRKIRMWRPDVIVTYSGEPATDSLEQFIHRVLMAATEKAADANQYASQIDVGLRAWQVKRVFGMVQDADAGDTLLVSAQFAPRLGRSLASQSALARAVLDDGHPASPAKLAFRTEYCGVPSSSQRHQWFDGIIIKPGGEARRHTSSLQATSLNSLKRSAVRQRAIEQLLSNQSGPRTAVSLLGQIEDLTTEMDVAGAAGILFHLAQSYRNELRLDLAAEVLQLLVQRYPSHDLALPSMIWLASFYGSSETAWQVEKMGLSNLPSGLSRAAYAPTVDRYVNRTIDFADYYQNGPSAGSRPAFHRSESQQEGSQREGSRGSFTASLGRRAQHATELAGELNRHWPAHYTEPEIRFLEAAALRNQGELGLAERATRSYSVRNRRDAWAASAHGETWLRQPDNDPPKPVAVCAFSQSKPRLDGLLDDDVWRMAQPIHLKSHRLKSSLAATTVMLARDDQFLYLAIRCQKEEQGAYPEANGTRGRDPDLSGHDRVDLYLDLDRDYATYYHLTIDHRGWVGDSLWDIERWNPTWYVASKQDAGAWSVEAALPLAELTAKSPTRRDVWAIGIQRTTPNVGFQSWSWPASVRPRPEGFGYLTFE